MSDPNLLVLVIPVTVTVNRADYELNYGRTDDVAEYTAEIVRDAANERFKLLEWALVSTEPTTDPRTTS